MGCPGCPMAGRRHLTKPNNYANSPFLYLRKTPPTPLWPDAWPLAEVFALFPALKARLHQRAARLSGGEQQMLAIARPLVMGSRFLLLDEPTEGLAPVIVELIGNVLRQLKERALTILLVEQNLRFASSIADRHYLMVNGRIAKMLKNSEIATEEAELREFLGV